MEGAIVTYKPVLLDDHAMILQRDLFASREDLITSILACPEWRGMNMSVSEDKVQVYRNDLIPRLHLCVDLTAAFVAHYLMLLKHRDIPLVRNMRRHLLIDRYAHGVIFGIVRRLQQWNTTSEEAELVHDLVTVLHKSPCHETAGSVPWS